MDKSTNPTKKIEPRTVKGFRDLDPIQAQRKADITQALRVIARSFGFKEIATPALEFAEVLLGASHEETDKEVYRLDDAGGRALALRFDLTVPFARFVAEHQATLNFPFKRFQCDEVWRGEKPQKGRFRQFCQADFDIVGVDSIAADVMVVHLIQRSLHVILGDRPISVVINSRPILTALLKAVYRVQNSKSAEAVEEGKFISECLIGIDKLAKIGVAGVEKILGSKFLCFEENELGRKLLHLLVEQQEHAKQERSDEECLKPLQEFLRAQNVYTEADQKNFEKILKQAQLIRSIVPAANIKIRIDTTIARGLAYYTGIVFECFADQLQGFGSLASGGRYHELIERFQNRNIPGVGGSVGVDRVLAALEEFDVLESANKPKTPEIIRDRKLIFVGVAEDDCFEYAFDVAEKIRSQGFRVDLTVQTGSKSLGHQMKYADRGGCSYAIIIGREEQNLQAVKIKELATGNEHGPIPVDEVSTILAT